ncbi:MAG: glutamate--tRNA ligase [Planctomycetes bacterium]|nr:glutamate--tRNA ligase [Planctomycetota bacterium]
MTGPVRTRFAPSPTGHLHIGGLRTALFNWLFTRRHGGQFILRIDDTDQDRNVAEALAPILRGLRWLGIDWDEGPDVGGPCAPYYQSQRLERHQAAVRALLEKGLAYWDYATTEEIAAERAAAQKEKRQFVYSRKWMAASPEDRTRLEAGGRKGVVRLRMPRDGQCVIQDLVRGEVRVDWVGEQDHVIQRADGSCLYHLASVVDDRDMGITHVIRAEEHLPNTPRQVFMIQGLGSSPPEYAHLPFVAEPGSHVKLSKRKLDQYLKNADFARVTEHGRAIASAVGLPVASDTFNPVIVDFYEQVGYLPQAVRNYLLLLGWSLDGTTEFFTREEMIGRFSLERVNKAPASFDAKKLWAFQDQYMRQVPVDEKVPMVLPYLEKAGVVAPPAAVRKILEFAGDRIKVAGDILDHRHFFLPDDAVPMDEAAFEKRLRKPPEAAGLLRKLQARLDGHDRWDAPSLEALVRDFVASEKISLGQIVHAVRVAVTGRAEGIGMFETLEIMGRERTLARIARALARL